MEDETPKETLLKPKPRKTPVKQTEEDRAIIAMRMREINDKKIMETAEKIRKQQPPKEATKSPLPPTPPPPPVEAIKEEIVAPKIIRQKKFIKVIEITDDEESDDEPPVIIKKKPKAKPLEETPVKKPRVSKPKEPKEPKEPPKPIYEPPPMPRGRFL